MATSLEPCLSDQEAASNLVGELYEAHGGMVVGLCRFLLRDPTEAEDAAQQSFMAAHRSLLGGAVPRDAPAWLATIARNECRARIKQRMREPLPLREPDGTEGQLPDPFQEAAKNADLRAIRDGLEALPETQRNAFVLREFAGLSYEELAVALGVTEPAVESLLVRARSKLRLALVHANPMVVPLVIRDQLARLTTGFDDGSASAVAKLVSIPLAAKLAAAGAGVALIAAGGSLSDRSGGDRLAPVRVPVAAAADRLVAPASTGHGASGLSSSTRRFADAIEREDAYGAGGAVRVGVHDGSAARPSSDDLSKGSGSPSSGSSTPSLPEDDSAPSASSAQTSGAAGGDSGGDSGARETPAGGDTSAASDDGKEGSSTPISGGSGGSSTSSASSGSEPTESEDHHSSSTSGSGDSHDSGKSSDDSHSSDN